MLAFVLAVLLLGGYLGRLGGYPLQDPDEGRYAEIAREMAVSGDWVTPTLNHVKYFDKPPLLYWLVAGLFRIFGATERVARIVPASAGLLTVGITFLLGRSMFGSRVALMGSLILATSPLFFFFSQALTTDMLLTAYTTATMASVWAMHRGVNRGRWAAVLAGSAALGVLAKGLVALVLPGFAALAFLLVRGDRATVRQSLSIAPIAVFVAVAAPWFVAVSWASPEFGRYFFYTQHIERFATAAVGHPEGPLFYVPVLLAGALPWTALLAMVGWPFQGRLPRVRTPEGAFLLIWASSVLVFFSIARSKLPAYILPAFPALALLGGSYLGGLDGAEQRLSVVAKGTVRTLVVLSSVLALVAIVSVPFTGLLGDLLNHDRVDVAVVLHTAVVSGVSVALLGMIVDAFWSQIEISPLRSVSAVAACTGLLLFSVIPARDVVKTSRAVGASVRAHYSASDVVISYKRVMHGFPFYSGLRPVQAVSFGELEFGSRFADDKDQFFWADREQVAKAWRSSRRVFVVTSRKFEPELREVLQPAPHVLVRDADRLVLVNFDVEPGASRAGRTSSDSGSRLGAQEGAPERRGSRGCVSRTTCTSTASRRYLGAR